MSELQLPDSLTHYAEELFGRLTPEQADTAEALATAKLCRARFRPFLVEGFKVVEETTRLVDSWYLGASAEHAEALLTGQLTRLVVTQPPGTLKSLTWCVLFPAWAWVNWPQLRFLLATHDLPNADRDAGYCRNLVSSAWYQSTFSPTWKLADDQNAKRFYQTTRGGHRLSVSTGGAVGGKKGHVLIVDDLHDPVTVSSAVQRKADKDWFRQGFSDRMMNFRTGAVAVVGHRLRKDDLAGELIEEGWPELRIPEEFGKGGRKTFPVSVQWEGRTLTADPRTKEGDWLRPQRFSEAEKSDRVKSAGSLTYEAKHNQEPADRKGQMFDPDKPRRVPTYPVGTVAVRYWDTAASESESACHSSGVLIGRTPEGRTIIIDVDRDRWGPTQRNQHMRNRGLEDMKRQGLIFRRLYWEKGTSDSGLERDQILARHLAGIPCAADRAKGSKVDRAEGLAAQWDAGNVDIVEGDWNRGYLSRMAEFPQAKDKDDTDASSGGFNRLFLSDDDPDGYHTAAPEETHFGQLAPGTFDTHTTDPYT